MGIPKTGNPIPLQNSPNIKTSRRDECVYREGSGNSQKIFNGAQNNAGNECDRTKLGSSHKQRAKECNKLHTHRGRWTESIYWAAKLPPSKIEGSVIFFGGRGLITHRRALNLRFILYITNVLLLPWVRNQIWRNFLQCVRPTTTSESLPLLSAHSSAARLGLVSCCNVERSLSQLALTERLSANPGPFAALCSWVSPAD